MTVASRVGAARTGLVCACALVLALVLLAAPHPAQADFTAQMCNGRTAAPWVNGPPSNLPFVGIQDECSTPAGEEVFFISGQNTMPQQTNDDASVIARRASGSRTSPPSSTATPTPLRRRRSPA